MGFTGVIGARQAFAVTLRGIRPALQQQRDNLASVVAHGGHQRRESAAPLRGVDIDPGVDDPPYHRKVIVSDGNIKNAHPLFVRIEQIRPRITQQLKQFLTATQPHRLSDHRFAGFALRVHIRSRFEVLFDAEIIIGL